MMKFNDRPLIITALKKDIFVARKVLSGLLTHKPVLYRKIQQLRDVLFHYQSRQVGISNALYCYAVWMRHLMKWHEFGSAPLPGRVMEIGPGGSLGVGMAALLTGCERYYAIDVTMHVDFSKNIEIFDDLIQIFGDKISIPDYTIFPNLGGPLTSHAFPVYLLSSVHRGGTLREDRLDRIRKDLRQLPSLECNDYLFYITSNGENGQLPQPGSLDWIISQFVMEHIDDPLEAYRQYHYLLKPGGLMTHHIDFCSHWTSYDWNGYWTYSDKMWRLIRGKRPYFINRIPLSEHISYMASAGFKVLEIIKTGAINNVPQHALAPRFRNLTPEDLRTANAMITTRKFV